MINIDFINHTQVALPIEEELICRWVGVVASGFNKIVGQITYIFCDDDEILDVNRKFINHDYYTDIITFDYSRRAKIAGDIYISLDTVASNAELFDVPFINELHRVLIHGILHLCGINDKGPGEREIMEKFEDQSLALLKKLQK